jgi:hypothetical protein
MGTSSVIAGVAPVTPAHTENPHPFPLPSRERAAEGRVRGFEMASNKAKEDHAMSFTEFFENLSQEINDSRTGRRARIQEICTDVENFLDKSRSARQQMAKELRRKLKTDDKARVKAAHELMGELRTRIGGIFSSTHNMLNDFAADLRRGGEIFRGNSAASFRKESSKESRRKKRQ